MPTAAKATCASSNVRATWTSPDGQGGGGRSPDGGSGLTLPGQAIASRTSRNSRCASPTWSKRGSSTGAPLPAAERIAVLHRLELHPRPLDTRPLAALAPRQGGLRLGQGREQAGVRVVAAQRRVEHGRGLGALRVVADDHPFAVGAVDLDERARDQDLAQVEGAAFDRVGGLHQDQLGRGFLQRHDRPGAGADQPGQAGQRGAVAERADAADPAAIPAPPGAHWLAPARIRLASRSIAVTTRTITARIVSACPRANSRTAICSSRPGPPAPTMPSTKAARTSDSQRRSVRVTTSGGTRRPGRRGVSGAPSPLLLGSAPVKPAPARLPAP